MTHDSAWESNTAQVTRTLNNVTSVCNILGYSMESMMGLEHEYSSIRRVVDPILLVYYTQRDLVEREKTCYSVHGGVDTTRKAPVFTTHVWRGTERLDDSIQPP